jgi:hypothetical protein
MRPGASGRGFTRRQPLAKGMPQPRAASRSKHEGWTKPLGSARRWPRRGGPRQVGMGPCLEPTADPGAEAVGQLSQARRVPEVCPHHRAGNRTGPASTGARGLRSRRKQCGGRSKPRERRNLCLLRHHAAGTPSVMRQVPRWLLNPLGPPSIRPTCLPSIAPWLWRFWRASAPTQVASSIATQASLMRLSVRATSALIRSADAQAMRRAGGNLRLYDSKSIGPHRSKVGDCVRSMTSRANC